MMTSSNGNIFLVTGHLYGEFIGHQWRRALMFSSQGAVSSTMMTHLTVSDHITMTGCSWVCTIWCWKWRASFRSAAIFQSLAGARNFCPCGLLTCRVGASPSWRKMMHGFGSWVGCSLATLHWVSVNSASMVSTRLWRHVYIWRELPQDERTCRMVPLADLHIAQVSSPVKPHCLWLAGVGRRL